ncbi:MAG: hypothetical protein NVSMB18_07990 [Acetobacteraceae bacterium]
MQADLPRPALDNSRRLAASSVPKNHLRRTSKTLPRGARQRPAPKAEPGWTVRREHTGTAEVRADDRTVHVTMPDSMAVDATELHTLRRAMLPTAPAPGA